MELRRKEGTRWSFDFPTLGLGSFPPNKSRTLSLFAEVGLLSQSDDEVGTIVQWEEPVTVRLPNDREVVPRDCLGGRES